MRRLLIDVSSLLWQSLLASKDKEYGREVEHEGKMVHVNGWQYGYECAVNHLTSVMRELDVAPIDCIFVVEGQYAKSRRKAIYADYKTGRDSRPPEAYEQFGLLRNKLTQDFRNLGSQIVTQDGVEGDDIIAYLARNLDGEKVILTTDGDLATLIDENTALWRGDKLTRENPYGPFPCRFIPVYKALCGDGNEYKGAAGFGPKAFFGLLTWLISIDSGLAALEGMMKRQTLSELEDDVADFKPFRKVIDNAQHVYQSYQCALLHDDWVNTLRQPLEWKAGMVRSKDVVTDSRLAAWAQNISLVTPENYVPSADFFRSKVRETPFFTLDIETSTPEESDDWLAVASKESKVDVLGSRLTGLSLTFGKNNQYTMYFSVDHANTNNVTSEQVRDLIGLIPQDKHIVIQNFAFEGPILYREWGETFKDNGWHGFLPNVVDTVFCASYVNENISLGLKQGSKHYLDYDQATYDSVTKVTMRRAEWRGKGSVLREYTADCAVIQDDIEVGDIMIDVQYKMNELPAKHVLSYGADDTICTAALFNHFRVIMEIEKTWDLMLEVEQLPSYVMALAFTHGTSFSLQRMNELRREDSTASAKEWLKLRDFLIAKGWEGTTAPTYTELTPASVKEMCSILLGQELNTRVRTVSKLAKLVEELDHEDAPLLAKFISEGSLQQINDWVRHNFKGEPVLDLGSPKQMRNLLYRTLGLPVRIVNNVTAIERRSNPLLARVISDHKKKWAGHDTQPIPDHLLNQEQAMDKEGTIRGLLMSKSKTDDTAIGFALAMDVADKPEVAEILNSIKRMKTYATRESLFYKPYTHMLHWMDNKIHGQAGQCRTVTRRFAPNDPNLGQLPKKGEGVKFRECYIPHKKGAVIVSVDFSGQELRQGAGQSMDPAMLACFVGDNKKDMHSMTAAGAMTVKWGKQKVSRLQAEFGEPEDSNYELFLKLRRSKDGTIHKMADDLRKNAKNVNFGAQYDAQAPKLAETLIIPVPDAEAFLQAKYAAFPRFEEWKEEVKEDVERLGYAKTPLGGRRHLRESVLSSEYGIKDKALRQGPNFLIQGASAEQTKLAMRRLWMSGILFKLDMKFFSPIHDELVWSVTPKDALESIKVVVNCMTQPYGNLPVPFLGSVSLGPNFGEQHECGDDAAEDPTLLDERVPQILAKIAARESVTV